ncbi:MAG: NAD(P)H-hydrate dehydratase [Rhizomicrobium sp.]|jgi:NAD(P)H-hydrate epimerase
MSAEILTAGECYAADRYAESCGIASLVLMENAGQEVARAIAGHYSACRTAVLCGPGNNGGDGFVAARYLRDLGWDVSIALLGEYSALTGDAREVATRWSGPVNALSPDAIADAELIVDAVFGAGLSRPLDGSAKKTAEAVNNRGVPVVAVDLPSGLSGDTGRAPDDGVCIHADVTVTFFRAKPVHVLMPGRQLCGETLIVDIGIPDGAIAAIRPRLFENGPALWSGQFPWPDPQGHKYKRGHAVVVSGPMYATGAARLAARSALRAGAGLVSVASPEDAVLVNAASLTAIMVKRFAGPAGLSALLTDPRFNAIAIGPGCGVGAETAELVSAVLATRAAVVLDADALTSFAGEPQALFSQLGEACVLTPHAGEFERLFPGSLASASSRIEATRGAAAAAGCTVLLKGPDTVIAHPSGQAAVNTNAPPWLATAGSGDVLTGLIAGLLAQGMHPFEAAAAGAWLHGEAANLFGPGLISEDIPEMLPSVLSSLASGA